MHGLDCSLKIQSGKWTTDLNGERQFIVQLASEQGWLNARQGTERHVTNTTACFYSTSYNQALSVKIRFYNNFMCKTIKLEHLVNTTVYN